MANFSSPQSSAQQGTRPRHEGDRQHRRSPVGNKMAAPLSYPSANKMAARSPGPPSGGPAPSRDRLSLPHAEVGQSVGSCGEFLTWGCPQCACREADRVATRGQGGEEHFSVASA